MTRRRPRSLVPRGGVGRGQLTFDDCAGDWSAREPEPRRRPAGTRYYLGLQNDLWGQRLRTSRIMTVPIAGEYL